MIWYVPTFYGDFNLEPSPKHPNKTILNVTKATALEKEQLTRLQVIAARKGWVGKKVDFLKKTTTINADMRSVADELAAVLKPDRGVLSVVRVAGGELEEVRKEAPIPEKAEAAVTVAKPVKGCPPTEFPASEIRARVVLEEFLTPAQLEDFRTHQRFLTIGADSGHRYMITSRHAQSTLAVYERSLYDIDAGRPMCAHDWAVPAAEEMLALHLCVSTPGNERHLRRLPAP